MPWMPWLVSFRDNLIAVSYTHLDNLFFQNISKSKLVKKKGILGFGEGYRYERETAILFINEYPDAIYIPAEDALYFQRLEPIASIFGGISELYREATEHEVEEFLQNDFIDLTDGFESSKVKVANRKRIAMAMDTCLLYTSRCV